MRWGELWRSVTESWRARRAQNVTHHSKPTYDAYPGEHDQPELKLYIEARDVRGRLLREYVELEGYSLHQLNWKRNAQRGGMLVRDWLVGQMLEAMVRLTARMDIVREEKQGIPNRKPFDPRA